MLSSWGLTFEAIDVAAEPGAWEDLRRLGIPLVPAVVAGDGAVHGWNPRALADLVGVAYSQPERLAPPELAARLDRVLAVAQGAILQVPPDRLDDPPSRGRDRSVRQLAYHIFRLSLAYPEAIASRRLPEAWLQEESPPELRDPAALASYGERVRERIRAWLVRPDAWEGTIETYYGAQTGPELLERTVWHAAQHVRQLHAFLERLGTAPLDPLTDADLRGLPLPEEV